MSATSLLIASIAQEEMALARLIYAESHKISQTAAIINRYPDTYLSPLATLTEVNESVESMMRKIITKEMLLSFQLEDAVELDAIETARPDFPADISMACFLENFYPGMSRVYYAHLSPTNARNRSISWSSSNPAVAYISATCANNATVCFSGPGTTTLTATTQNGLTASCDITVLERMPDDIRVTPGAIQIQRAATYQLQGEILPDNATDQTITWSSLNPSVATVDQNGLVYGVDMGTTTITATSVNNISANCSVEVIPEA